MPNIRNEDLALLETARTLLSKNDVTMNAAAVILLDRVIVNAKKAREADRKNTRAYDAKKKREAAGK